MLRYRVNKAFVDYGMYRGVGEIIKDASVIANLEVKCWDGTLTIIDDEGNEVIETVEEVAEPASEVTVTPAPPTVEPEIPVEETPKVETPTIPVIPMAQPKAIIPNVISPASNS